jgi:hypothetical protein
MQYEKREETYMQVINHYKPEEQKKFAELLAELVLAMNEEVQLGKPADILGEIYNNLELNDIKGKAQVFTPQDICNMMAKMIISKETCEENINSGKGYISICEPTCGAGAMIIGAMCVMQDLGYNYCTNLVVQATDLDIHCVYMCYLHIAIYGVPAVVIHGNSISQEEYSRWYTPIWVINKWEKQLRDSKADKRNVSESVTPDTNISE